MSATSYYLALGVVALCNFLLIVVLLCNRPRSDEEMLRPNKPAPKADDADYCRDRVDSI
jgi:hypothetical protein